MSYIIDFGERLETLNYALRIRGTSNGIVDLAGGTVTNYNVDYTSTPSNLGNGTSMKFNGTNAYLAYYIKDSLYKNEDFTLSIHLRDIDITRSSHVIAMFNGYDGVTEATYNDMTVPGLTIAYWNDYYNGENNRIVVDVFKKINGIVDADDYRPFYYNGLRYLTDFHFALINKNGILRIAINGEFLPQSAGLLADGVHNKDNMIYSGCNTLTGSTYKYSKFTLDDICVIKGRALWTSSFKPPTKYLPDKWPVYD